MYKVGDYLEYYNFNEFLEFKIMEIDGNLLYLKELGTDFTVYLDYNIVSNSMSFSTHKNSPLYKLLDKE